MTGWLLTGPLAPFTLALALLGGLLLLEVVALLVGGTLVGMDADAEFDLDATEFDAEVEGFAPGTPEFDGAPAEGAEAGVGGGLAQALGLAHAPFLVWLAALLLGFGLAGVGLQAVLDGIWRPLPAAIAVAPAAVLGLAFARSFARSFARLLPKTETSALTARQLARTRGTVTQGTAARGRPAEVRVTDRHGNVQYLRAEPARDDETIPRGAEVVVTWDRHANDYRLIPLTEGDTP